MQGSKTLDFWNRLHDQNAAEESIEWIVHPSSLLETLMSNIPSTPRVLEIGCGTSSLSKCLYEHVMPAEFCVTDVSPVCIQHNESRDAEFLQKHSSQFTYQVWNILEDIDQQPHTIEGKPFDVILDKGCLDTFLFRSETKLHYSLISTFLRFLLKWTKEKYLVITPRPKLPPLLRDYPGFSNLTRHTLTEGLADLEGDHTRRKQAVYLHVCIVDRTYKPTSSLLDQKLSNEDETIVCDHCGISSNDFLGGLNPGLPEVKKLRQWRGHQIHCRATVQN